MSKKKNKKSKKKKGRKKREFDQDLVDLARVVRVIKGGRRLRFRACIVIGNKKGKVGVGVAKGSDVPIAIKKAVKQAKKNIIEVPIENGTIPHSIKTKLGASRILLRPAPKGHGIIAGGVVRVILNLAGVKNATGKILGSNNSLNNAKAMIKALQSFKV